MNYFASSPFLQERSAGWTKAEFCGWASIGWKFLSPPNRTSHSSFNLANPSRQEDCCALSRTGPTFIRGVPGIADFDGTQACRHGIANGFDLLTRTRTRRMAVHFWPALRVISPDNFFYEEVE